MLRLAAAETAGVVGLLAKCSPPISTESASPESISSIQILVKLYQRLIATRAHH